MLAQNLKNIKNEYKCFLENIYMAESFLDELLEHSGKLLSDYCKYKNRDTNFAYKLEENLLYLEYISGEMKNLIECIDYITLQEIKIHCIHNFKNIHEQMFIPEEYEQDVYVDINNPISWDK